MSKPEGVKQTWYAQNRDEAERIYNADTENLPIGSPIYATSEGIIHGGVELSKKFPFSQKANGNGGCYFYSGMIAILNDCVDNPENWNLVKARLINFAGEDGDFKNLIAEISPEDDVLTREKVYKILQVRGGENIIAKLSDKLLVKGIAHSSGQPKTWGLDHFLREAEKSLEEYLEAVGAEESQFSSKDWKLIKDVQSGLIQQGNKCILEKERDYDSLVDNLGNDDLIGLLEGVIRLNYAKANNTRSMTYNAEYISPFFNTIYSEKKLVTITGRDLGAIEVKKENLYLWNADGQAHFDVIYPDLDHGIEAEVAALAGPISEPEGKSIKVEAAQTTLEKVEKFANTLTAKTKGSGAGPLDKLPSRTAVDKFLGLAEEEQNRILEGTRITITRAELDHARKFLALIFLTDGQKIPNKKSQKQIYVEQGILPKGLALAAEDGDLEAQIKEISEQITPKHIKAFYKRLVEKRPLASFNKSDDTLLRDGTRMKGIGCSGNHNPEEYTLYSEAEFASMLQVFGPTQFINDGRRYNEGKVGTEGGGEAHEASGYISGLVGMRLEIDDGMESMHVVGGNLTKQKEAHANALGWAGDHETRDFGRISGVTRKFVEGYEAIWQEFYKDGKGEPGEEEEVRPKKVGDGEFNDAAAEYRLYISYKKFLAESAKAIAEREDGEKEKAYIRITGLGDGVWAEGKSKEVRAAIGRAVARAYYELDSELKEKISAIEFSQFGHSEYSNAFKEALLPEGITERLEPRVSNAHFAHKIPDADADFKNVLFVNYAWDGLSYPGNEYYLGALSASGDPAAACCSSIVVSQNPQINSGFLDRVFVVEENGIIKTLDGYGAETPEVVLDFSESPGAFSDGGVEEESDDESEISEFDDEFEEYHNLDGFEGELGGEPGPEGEEKKSNEDLNKDLNKDLKYVALLAMEEMQEPLVSDNKLARAFKKLEGKSEVETGSDFEKIWKEELTTLDRIKLVEFYNHTNSSERIDFDEKCMNTLDLRKDRSPWEANKKNLSKIISWSIQLANIEENKVINERAISAAEASNKRFHGISSKEKGEIEEGVKQFLQYPKPDGVVLNPIAQALLKRLPQKEK